MPILPSVVHKEKIIYTLATAQVSNMYHTDPAKIPPQSTTQVSNMCPAEPSSSPLPHSPQLPPPGV